MQSLRFVFVVEHWNGTSWSIVAGARVGGPTGGGASGYLAAGAS
jgi:hypothetical protein